MDAFLKGDYPTALLIFDEILTKGFNALHFVAALSSHLRDLIVSKSGGLDALLELPESLKIKYKDQADRCHLQFLYDALGITTQCESGYRASVNPRLHIEFALMRLSFLMVKPAGAAPVAAAPAAAPVSAPVAPVTPVAPAPAPAPAAPSAPAEPAAPVPADPAPQPAPAAPAAPDPEAAPQPARERRARAASAASVSLKSMMNADAKPVEQTVKDVAPSEEALKEKWPELAKVYESKPRLASMLGSTTITVSGDDESKIVTFMVVNEAQKDWVESKLLHDLEGSFRTIVGSSKVYLRVDVTPDDAPQPKVYMPSDKAKELMSENDEVKNLVKDFGLDIK